MTWLDTKTSLYKCNADNKGEAVTFRDILLTRFAIEHDWFYKPDLKSEKWLSGKSVDLATLIEMRKLDSTDKDYTKKKTELKKTLQCFTPAALLETKKSGEVKEISRTGLMQLDFDYVDIAIYDVEELKQAVFALPFIAFCGLSCSGDGFYALAEIAEPGRLSEYAEHCFAVFERYGIKADKSKGKKVENLRYVSYDSNMLINENPVPLKIPAFKRKEAGQQQRLKLVKPITLHNNNLISSELKKVRGAQLGQRWQTIQQVGYTLGGLGDESLLNLILDEIRMNAAFEGEEAKYTRCAEYCFKQGAFKPLIAL